MRASVVDAYAQIRAFVEQLDSPPADLEGLARALAAAGKAHLLAELSPARRTQVERFLSQPRTSAATGVQGSSRAFRSRMEIAEPPMRPAAPPQDGPGRLDIDSPEVQRALELTRGFIKNLDRGATRASNAQQPSAFEPLSAERDELGMVHVRLQRMHHGMPVFGEQIISHTRGERVEGLTGDPTPPRSLVEATSGAALETPPALAPQAAAAAAREHFQTQTGLVRSGTAREEPPRLVLLPHEGTYKRVYHTAVVDLAAKDAEGHQRPTVMQYFVDADTGAILRSFNSLPVHGAAPHGRSAAASAGTATGRAEPNAPIRDRETTEATIPIDDELTITDVTVDFGAAEDPGIRHTYRGDLRITLVSPSGTEIVLRKGSDTEDGAKDVFGRYDLDTTPELAKLVGQPAAGTWKVRVTDQLDQDQGTFRFVGLQLHGTGPDTIGAEQPVNASLADHQSVSSDVVVAGADVRAGRVQVTVDIDHPEPADVTIVLRAPSGTSHEIHKTLRRQEGSLRGTIDVTSLFGGEVASGTWKMSVRDHAAGDEGTWKSWAISIVPGEEPGPGLDRSIFYGEVELSTSKNAAGEFVLHDPTRGKGITTQDAMNADPNGIAGRFEESQPITDQDDQWATATDSPRQAAAVDAHYASITMYDFLRVVLGRNSLDGNGEALRSMVHVGEAFVNAFWYMGVMHYGDGDGRMSGPLVALDVGGHEVSHGLAERTAGLIYSGQSGGLNEANSDILGTGLEWFASKRNGAVKFDWTIGEDTWTPGEPDDGLRYMDDPTRDGRSIDHLSKYEDGIDVHHSSGIANNFFYLLVAGGTNRTSGLSVDGLQSAFGGGEAGFDQAMESALKVWFRALAYYMTPNTTFVEARTATLQAAKDLFPDQPAVGQMIASAWKAVGVESATLMRA